LTGLGWPNHPMVEKKKKKNFVQGFWPLRVVQSPQTGQEGATPMLVSHPSFFFFFFFSIFFCFN
jgi:hypothetical protein